MSDAVVLVHGIWMTGLDLVPLRRRFRDAGYDAVIFRYPSLVHTPAANASLLSGFLDQVEGDVVHFVGHSLGGLVLLHLFDRFEVPRPGRVVFLGSPANGSAVARVLAGRTLTRPLIGRSGEKGLLGGTPRWTAPRDLGVVAGERAIGVGRILGGIEGASDGTVAVDETRIPGAADHVTLPVTHTGLVFSEAVYEHAERFLRTGRFA